MHTTLDITIIEQFSKEDLVIFIKHLMSTDFEKLVFLLYRIDVHENKVKQLLNTSTINSEELIAQAIIDRLAEKKITKEKYKQMKQDIDEEDRWTSDI
ncbi:MAG: hypothetical protein KF781_09785 [Chitinophagaceae bacterium]|nr:hypothetical protein [Chitinophagaceae bacterium]